MIIFKMVGEKKGLKTKKICFKMFGILKWDFLNLNNIILNFYGLKNKRYLTKIVYFKFIRKYLRLLDFFHFLIKSIKIIRFLSSWLVLNTLLEYRFSMGIFNYNIIKFYNIFYKVDEGYPVINLNYMSDIKKNKYLVLIINSIFLGVLLRNSFFLESCVLVSGLPWVNNNQESEYLHQKNFPNFISYQSFTNFYIKKKIPL